ncbi:MAG: S8 family serine peptidase, partial [Anaerolineae bacterium]
GSVDQLLNVSGAGVPPDVEQLIASPRGETPISAEMTGDLYYSPSGGCLEEGGASGKIVVADRFGKGTCGYPNRADAMAKSGAKAIIYYYNDRNLGGPSSQALALPSVAVGLQGGKSLVTWLQGGGSGKVTIRATIMRGKSDVADVVSPSSSQGPGLDWQLKPDVAAPGEGTMSSVIFIDKSGERLYRVDAKSGTSMATPHVTGAVGVLRGAHPDWTVDQVRSAIINTSNPALRVNVLEPKAAMPYDGGPGRLDVAAALDPGAFLSPTKLSFGKMSEGATRTISVTMESDLEVPAKWTLAVEPSGGQGAVVTASPDSVTLEPGQKATFNVVLAVPASVADSEHWGNVVLTTDAGGKTHRLRQQYYAFVDRAAARKNVLIVDWVYGSKVDHTRAYTEALEAAGLTYDVWVLDNAQARVSAKSLPIQTSHPPLSEMSRHDLVILNTNESKTSMMAVSLSGLYQYQNHMLRGGAFLIAGQGTANFWRYLNTAARLADTPQLRQTYAHSWPFQWSGAPSQNFGCEMCLMRYFAGFTPEYTSTLSGRLLVPFPQKPDMTARSVVLQPNAAAEAATPFDYPLDLSTGDKAAAGAAGNQYTFTSGSVVGGYKATTSNVLATGFGDYDYSEGIIDDLVPLAKPLWQYTGDFAVDGVHMMTKTEQTKVVGTYVAGQQHPGTGVTWNAMIWGFGLEGVGAGADGKTVGRDRLLGDTFNFLARNLTGIAPTVVNGQADMFEMGLSFPDFASPPRIAKADVDWGDGQPVETLAFSEPIAADEIRLEHAYAKAGEYAVTLVLHPTADAAPIHVKGTVTATAPARPPAIYLPVAVSGPLGGNEDVPAAFVGRRDQER